MPRESRSRLQAYAEIPVVSMADIAFLLILFFMLTSTFVRQTGVDVKLPKTAEAEALPERDISVEVTKEGQVSLDGRQVPIENLQAALKVELAATSSPRVTIRGDQMSPYGVVVQVMAIVRAEGAEILCAAEQQQP